MGGLGGEAQGSDDSPQAKGTRTKMFQRVKRRVRIWRATIRHAPALVLNPADRTRISALHVAARNNNTAFMCLLLEAGADKDALDSTGCTPLHIAAIEGNVAATEVLLDADADATLRHGSNNSSAMEWAAFKGHAGVVQQLIRYGVDVNAAGSTGLTALFEAVRRNHVEVMRLLLEAGADKNVFLSTGCTPLHLAAILGHLAATEVLLDADADATRRYGWKKLTAMEWAAFKGHAGVVQALIRRGVDLNAAGPTGLTALHEAVRNDHVHVVEYLLDAGADADQQCKSGFTPLHLASWKRAPHATLALLRRGASVALRDNTGSTPLHRGAKKAREHGAAECVDLMLRWGADENAVDNKGQTAADLIERQVDGIYVLPEEFVEVRRILESAPADRSWRRRGLMILGRAYPNRLRLPSEGSVRHAMMVPKTGTNNVPSDAQANGVVGTGGSPDVMAGDDFGRVVATLMDVPIDSVFRSVVSYL